LSSDNLNRETLEKIRLKKFTPQWLKKEVYDKVATDEHLLSLMRIEEGGEGGALKRRWGAAKDAERGHEVTAYI
jgi:hypothetical protein